MNPIKEAKLAASNPSALRPLLPTLVCIRTSQPVFQTAINILNINHLLLYLPHHLHKENNNTEAPPAEPATCQFSIMPPTIDQSKILAFAVFELRLLLAGHLGPESNSEPAVQAAAHLAYALHNQALAVLEGKSFNPTEAVEAIARVDQMFDENFIQQLQELTTRAV